MAAVGFYYGQLFIWETQTGRPVSNTLFQRADGTRDTFFQAKLIRFSPDGNLLAAASGSRLKIVQTQTGKVLADHYHEATPKFAHLRWADPQQVILVSQSTIKQIQLEPVFLGRVTADILPRLYVWDWKVGPPVPKRFPKSGG